MVKRFFIVFCALTVVAISVVGIRFAMHSSQFIVQAVETQGDAPGVLSGDEIQELAGVSVGVENLFDLDLGKIEARVLANPWVASVDLRKQFPATLIIAVNLRSPVGIFQNTRGELSYVDAEGVVFLPPKTKIRSDLPVFEGFSEKDMPEIKSQLINLLGAWRSSNLGPNLNVSSLGWSEDKGFRMVVLHSRRRTIIEMGQNIDSQIKDQLFNLKRVFDYLAAKAVPAKRLFLAGAEKIVVKSYRGL